MQAGGGLAYYSPNIVSVKWFFFPFVSHQFAIIIVMWEALSHSQMIVYLFDEMFRCPVQKVNDKKKMYKPSRSTAFVPQMCPFCTRNVRSLWYVSGSLGQHKYFYLVHTGLYAIICWHLRNRNTFVCRMHLYNGLPFFTQQQNSKQFWFRPEFFLNH